MLVSPFVFFGAIAVVFPDHWGLCNLGDLDCSWKYRDYETSGVFTALFSFVLFFITCILFVRLKVNVAYLSWRKFAVWYLPIVTILILAAGGHGGGNGFNPGYGMDSESLTFFFSGLFFLISLILIIYQSIKLRNPNRDK